MEEGKAMNDFIRVKGDKFVRGCTPILFKGLGIGSWLNIEHFMMGIPCTDQMMRESFANVYGKECAADFFNRLADAFVTEADFVYLHSLGINLLRVPFNYRLFWEDEDPDCIREDGFRYFDRLFSYAHKYGIYILPDLHSVPGGQNPDWHSDNRTGYTEFWQYRVFRNQMAKLWGVIAERYSEETYLLGYDLLNEPYVISNRLTEDDERLIQEFYESATAEIRKKDNNHILFLEGDHFAMRFDCISQICDEQTALMFHYYPTVWDAELYNKDYPVDKRKEVFERTFEELLEIRERFHRPVICGEAGYETDWEDLDFTAGLIEETLRLFQKYQVSFTMWSYKDAAFMSLVYPSASSEWMKLAGKFREVWNHDKETILSRKEVDDFCRNSGFSASLEERDILTFRQRAILYSLEQKHLLEQVLQMKNPAWMLAIPQSFVYENCEHFSQYELLLMKFTFD